MPCMMRSDRLCEAISIKQRLADGDHLTRSQNRRVRTGGIVLYIDDGFLCILREHVLFSIFLIHNLEVIGPGHVSKAISSDGVGAGVSLG